VKALIVEDDPQTLEAILLIFKLRWPELEPLSTSQGSEAALIVEKEAPDIVILDLGLPDMSGLEALKEIRAFSDVPLVIITARDDPTSHIKGLELGADDYITKPFDPGILLARIKNVLAHARAQNNQTSNTFERGGLVIHFDTREASFQGGQLNLTPTEYKLLCHLAKNAGRVLAHDNIVSAVWGEEYKGSDVLKTAIYQLRQKLVKAGAKPEIITAERGVGYRFML